MTIKEESGSKNGEINYAVRRQLSWTHLRSLMFAG